MSRAVLPEGIMKILLAIDNSKFSEAATQAVITQHQRPGTEVKIIHVVDLAQRMPARHVEELRAETLKEGEALVAKAAERLRSAGIKAVTDVEEGDPRARIIDNAVRWPADLVVLGSHGRTGLEYLRMGSVAESVARHSPCSVEIVRLNGVPR
jgi:nucleotide-binding universal stress UspA family protein